MKKLVSLIFAFLISFSAFAQTKGGIMLQDQGGLFEEKDNLMVWVKSLERGTEIDIYFSADGQPLEKVSKRIVEKKEVECTCYKARYDNKDYWVLNDRVSVAQTRAVIKYDCAVYKTADFTNPKNINLEVGDIVTIGKSKWFHNTNLYEISYFDDEYYTIRTGYILDKKFSTDEEDYNTVKIAKKLLQTNNETILNELIETAQTFTPCEEIKYYLEVVIFNIFGPDFDSSDVSYTNIEGRSVSFNIPEGQSVNIRAKPGRRAEIIDVITPSEEVSYEIDTNLKAPDVIDTINGDSQYWYEIQYTVIKNSSVESKKGWIFGIYLDIN